MKLEKGKSITEAIKNVGELESKIRGEYPGSFTDAVEASRKKEEEAEKAIEKHSEETSKDLFNTDEDRVNPIKVKTDGGKKMHLTESLFEDFEEDDKEDIDSSELKSMADLADKKSLKEELKLYTNISNYKPWSGAIDTWNKIVELDKVDKLEILLEESYPEGLSITELNDLLWFEDEWIFEMLGISNEEEDED